MKISEKWLREWVNPEVKTEVLVEQLTNAGLEVDSVAPAAGAFTDVVVAEVSKIDPHPDAKKLQVCLVNTGADEMTQVVCGAANVAVGMRVPFAKTGASLPGGMKIKKAKLRGVESFGMLCSEQELGMADHADGLLVLPADAPLGVAVDDYLKLDDQIIELDLTPNRGDCLGMEGVARDVAAINAMPFNTPDIASVPQSIDDTFPVQLDAPESCPAYVGRVIKGIDGKAATPLWMQERLRRAGLRSLGPVVDVTNYVLLELGQPMHAFDLDKLNGTMHVRLAKAKESLTLLDGKTVELDSDVLVIADEKEVLAMAGIMGGEASAVSDATVNIFLESAYFNPLSIAGRARRFGLHTDSSHRFERGVDPQLQARAMQRATALLLEIVGGEAGPLVAVVDQTQLPQPVQIPLRRGRVERLLGVQITAKQIETYMQLLNISLTGDAGQWTASPPSYRFDLTIEADLIEEIARLYGYNRLPETRPQVPQCMVGKAENRHDLNYFKDVLCQRGWQEAISYSFVDPAWQAVISPDRQVVALSNPLSSEMSQMRTSHWTGLLQALQHNQHRQQQQIRLFETGLNFIAQGESLDDIAQETWISGVAAGDYAQEHWLSGRRPIDFFDIKGDVEALMAHTRDAKQFEFRAQTHPALHPGQSARIYRKQTAVGWLGALHPAIVADFSLDGPVFLFEINTRALMEARPRNFSPLSKYPANRRDLALVVDEAVTARQICETIENVGIETIKDIRIFDLYQGKGIESGRKSVALGLILQDYSRTLTDEEVEEVISIVVAALGKTLGANLRDGDRN